MAHLPLLLLGRLSQVAPAHSNSLAEGSATQPPAQSMVEQAARGTQVGIEAGG